MSLERIPLRFIVFIDYDRHTMKKAIRVGIDSESDDDMHDLASEEGVKGFINGMASFFWFPFTNKEIDYIAEKLTPRTLSQDATEEDVRRFTEKIIREVEDLIYYTREKERETENMVYSFDIDIPIISYDEMIALITDRIYAIDLWLDSCEPIFTGKNHKTFMGIIDNKMTPKEKQLFVDIKNLLDMLTDSMSPHSQYLGDRIEKYKEARAITDRIIDTINSNNKSNTKQLRKDTTKIYNLVTNKEED